MKTNVPADHIGIFHDKYRFSSGKCVWCFYATISGQCPIKTEGAWYNYIDNCNELLAVKNTRATWLLLETMTTTTASTNLIDQTLPQQPAKKKRKVSELYRHQRHSSKPLRIQYLLMVLIILVLTCLHHLSIITCLQCSLNPCAGIQMSQKNVVT